MKFGAMLVLAAGLAAAQAAPVLWFDDSSGNLGKVDVATGDVTMVGSMGVVMTDTGMLGMIGFARRRTSG